MPKKRSQGLYCNTVGVFRLTKSLQLPARPGFVPLLITRRKISQLSRSISPTRLTRSGQCYSLPALIPDQFLRYRPAACQDSGEHISRHIKTLDCTLDGQTYWFHDFDLDDFAMARVVHHTLAWLVFVPLRGSRALNSASCCLHTSSKSTLRLTHRQKAE